MSEEIILKKIAEAASDYLLGQKMPEFAEMNGGLEALRSKLAKHVEDYEHSDYEESAGA